MPPAGGERSHPLSAAARRFRVAASWPWHPLVVGQIPILSAYLANRHEVTPHDALVPAGLTLVVTVAGWAVLAWVLRGVARSALAVSGILLCFFNFDKADDALSAWTGGHSGQAAVLEAVGLAGLGLLLAVGLRWIAWRPQTLRTATRFLNAFALLVVAATLALVAKDVRGLARDRAARIAEFSLHPAAEEALGEPGAPIETAPGPGPLPDVYHIILDAYGRADVLRDVYGYDNGAFVRWLRKKGFYVADRSAANYCQTYISLSSTLNCRYHDRLAGRYVPWTALYPALRHSSVLQTLQQHGYRFVSFASGYPPTEFPDADVYVNPFPASAPRRNEFCALLLAKTPLRLWPSAWGARPDEKGQPLDGYAEQRRRLRYAFDHLATVVREPSPKFVFAHIVCPHPPFVFGENGEDISPRERPYFATDGSYYRQHYGKTAEYVPGYRRQLVYATKRAREAIEAILRESERPPVIILQADHGPGSHWECDEPAKSDVRERMGILNAYYLPGGGDKDLYPEISPVNSFRVVFNRYFGAKLKLLPDESYFSSLKDPFQFMNVTARVR